MPTPFNAWLAQICSYLFLFSLAVALTGDLLLTPLGALGQRIKTIKANQPLVLYGAIFLLNSFASQLLSTGAFEIYARGAAADGGDELLFSKIRTGHVPTAELLLQLVRDHLNSK